LFALVQDITERKRAQSQLAESEQRYKSLFENNYDAVFSLDNEGYFSHGQSCCPAHLRVLGRRTLPHVLRAARSTWTELPRVRQAFIAALKGEPQTLR
jgi:PAS domain-containing protein